MALNLFIDASHPCDCWQLDIEHVSLVTPDLDQIVANARIVQLSSGFSVRLHMNLTIKSPASSLVLRAPLGQP